MNGGGGGEEKKLKFFKPKQCFVEKEEGVDVIYSFYCGPVKEKLISQK